MALPLSSAARAAIKSRRVAHAWLIELFTAEGTLRAWDKPMTGSYGGVDFEGIGDAWSLSEIKLSTGLVPQPITITFDGGLQHDDSSFVGRLLDRTWHQRKIRLRGLLLDPESNWTSAIGVHLDWNGYMDQISTSDQVSAPSSVVLTCESGVFRALDRSMTTCSNIDQKRRDPTDGFFRNTATKPTQDIPFGTGWKNVPGGGGRSGGGGGGGGGNFNSRVNSR